MLKHMQLILGVTDKNRYISFRLVFLVILLFSLNIFVTSFWFLTYILKHASNYSFKSCFAVVLCFRKHAIDV